MLPEPLLELVSVLFRSGWLLAYPDLIALNIWDKIASILSNLEAICYYHYASNSIVILLATNNSSEWRSLSIFRIFYCSVRLIGFVMDIVLKLIVDGTLVTDCPISNSLSMVAIESSFL